MFSRHPLAFREAEKFHLSSFIIEIIGTCCPWYIYLLSFLAWNQIPYACFTAASRSFVTSDRDDHIREGWWRQPNVLNSHSLFHHHMCKWMQTSEQTHSFRRRKKVPIIDLLWLGHWGFDWTPMNNLLSCHKHFQICWHKLRGHYLS